MAQGGSEGRGRYVAFISYSHRDAATGRWLHRRLETYRIPKRLVGSEGEHGPVPARLTPIFRDRDELPAAGDLSDKVRAALAVSDNLIVLCSPHSAGSPWVAKEIETFRALHPDRQVFAAIVEGEPTQCFPPALSADGRVEPLAADLRKEGDGRRLGVLKLVAGLAGVGLDDLVRRDLLRRQHRVTAVTLGSLAAVLIMAVLTALALTARAEAERQRAKAEGLVEFMLTDLRDRLKGVGRLDVLTAANQRALEHYGEQTNLGTLPAESLERRARVLHAIGEDDIARGDLAAALRAFNEAHRATGSLLSRSPNHADRIYAHAQSEYWIGYIDYARKDFKRAKAAFERYKALADRLVAMDPTKAEWLKESGFAEGNLCSMALEEPVDPAAALRSCAAALARMKEVSRRNKGDANALVALQNREGWMVNAWVANGNWQQALIHRSRQEALIRSLIRNDPRNLDYRDIWMRDQFGFGEILARRGEVAEARKRFADAAATAAMLRARDPQNVGWRDWQAKIAAAMK